MYAWLEDALQESSCVVTANRRLARTLTDAYAKQQLAAGRSAWRSPDIVAWPDWLEKLLQENAIAGDMPAKLAANQARVLWERCLRREVSDPLLNVSMLVQQAQEAWTRLQEWHVSLDTCAAAAAGRDQNIFVSAAQGYDSILRRNQWLDDASMTSRVREWIASGAGNLPARCTFAGFDRYTPAADALLQALQARGVQVIRQQHDIPGSMGRIANFENPDAELRAAGSWARHLLAQRPDCSIAIVMPGLEKDARRAARLLREGLAPGWQTESAMWRDAVNVSYGRRLDAYPLVAAAFTALEWIATDIDSKAVSMLLRSPAVGQSPVTKRSGLELRLRQQPARLWSPISLSKVLGPADRCRGDARDFMARVAAVNAMRQSLPSRATPTDWAGWINDALQRLNWPGDATLSSDEFQLVNRWRELLNEFARLQVVIPAMTLSEALARLRSIAAGTVFQPESETALVQLLGPLEAAGMQFDALWLAGMTAENWPPAGRPSPLLSRKLQRDHAMPDAEPQDTLDYAERVLARLAASCSDLVCSYALSDNDAEQSRSELLENIARPDDLSLTDPDWYANQLASAATVVTISADPVPAVTKSEKISGGAGAIQRQFSEPFAAFAYGRLGIRSLHPIPTGLPPSLRGRLLHRALWHLYRNFDDQAAIRSTPGDDLAMQISTAVEGAMRQDEIAADRVLYALLQLEKGRMQHLLHGVVELDLERPGFAIAELESEHELSIAGVDFTIRIDRVDKLESGGLHIIDYKTGTAQKLITSDDSPRDMQLVVYAMAFDAPVAELAYINIDTREVAMDGAGVTLTPNLRWSDCLPDWQLDVEQAVVELASGDLRLQPPGPQSSGRAYGLLSRLRELERNAS